MTHADKLNHIRRRSLFNFGRGTRHFCPILCINKIPEFYIIFAGKSNKIPKFYTRHLPENARILHYVWPKNISPGFFWGEVGRATPSPVSYAYGWAPGPPPAKSGPGAIAKMTAQCALYMGARKFFGTPWLRPRLLFATFFMGFCTDRPYDHMNGPTKFEVRTFTRSWDNSGYPKKFGQSLHFLQNF